MNREYGGSIHNHSDWSNIRLRDSINKIKDLVDYAGQLNHTIVGITEHEYVGNWIAVEKVMKEMKDKYPNLKVVRGNEIYLCRNGLNNGNFIKGQDKYSHFVLLAKNLTGAKQIMEISTRAWLRSYMARGMRRVPTYYNDLIDIIGENKGNVIGSTACLGGALPTQLLKYRDTKDEELLKKIYMWVQQMDDLFGHGNFFLELQPSKNAEQTYVNRALIQISKRFDIPYIITTDSHYLKKEEASIHKAYLNSQNGDREVDDFYATTYMMDTEELESYLDLQDYELELAYNNIDKIREMCEDYTISKPLEIPALKWKIHKINSNIEDWYDKIPYFKIFNEASQYFGDKELLKAIIEGIETHPDLQNERAYNEINSNLEMTWISSNVNKAHWSAYFLNLQNIIELCWEAGSLVGPGRGSGIGFILLYVLGITQINPLRETTKCFSWRFLNPERASVLDVDFDIEGTRRGAVLSKFREYYGNDRVANVATLRTEKSKSAILTAARGLGIDVDIAQYLSSMIPADRGTLRTLGQCMYGDESNGWAPIKQFVYEMTENYPQLWEVAQKIEGVICGSGIHAGGVIFVDKPFTESTALMRAPDGTVCTQFELHDAEAVSLIKYDALSVEAMDKIHICLDLLCEQGYISPKPTLKQTYEEVLGVYNLERDNKQMWQMVWEHKIQSLFQMEGATGIQGVAQLKPTSVDDLAILNSTLRLMAQKKGGEMPTEKLARFKANPNSWLQEMKEYGLGEREKAILEPVLGMSYGLCIAQEQFMELVQLPELGGFSLSWADKLRKAIAKKNPKEYDNLTNEFYSVIKEKNIDEKFAHYVWDELIAMSKGYGFNQSHTLAYSLIALQEMNLAHRFPIIFWDCACLTSDAGGAEKEENEEENNTSCVEEEYIPFIEDFIENSDDEDDDDEDEEETTKVKKKKTTKTTNYGKISAAIGKMKSSGVIVSPPDINKSTYIFSPDVEKNEIRYGMSGIVKVGEDVIRQILNNRPYSSIEDFLSKVKVNKSQMVNLIKAGAFDSLYIEDRIDIMKKYIALISEPKKTLNLRNMQKLIEFDLLPEKFDFNKRVFNYNKYLKKLKVGEYFKLDNIAFEFYEKNFDMDLLAAADTESGFEISATKWKKIYDSQMLAPKEYIKKNLDELLKKFNQILFDNLWDKYCTGTISKWEMDSVSYYSHEHELSKTKKQVYDCVDFFELNEEPEIDRIISIKGKQVPLFKIVRIMGTVLDRDKNKKSVTILTTSGVVTVKIYGEVFAHYDKQISELGADGKKHVKEHSFFKRGQKIIVTGIRRGDQFFAKKYSKTPYHLVELITEVDNDGFLVTKGTRYGAEE